MDTSVIACRRTLANRNDLHYLPFLFELDRPVISAAFFGTSTDKDVKDIDKYNSSLRSNPLSTHVSIYWV